MRERVFFFHVFAVDAATVAVAIIFSALKASRNTGWQKYLLPLTRRHLIGVLLSHKFVIRIQFFKIETGMPTE